MLDTSQDEETRKVQFTGGSTYIISLPKKWISENQLKKGSFLKLRAEEGGLLTLVPPEATVQWKIDEADIKVSANENTETTTRKIVAAYLGGYNSIHIKPDNQQLSGKQRHDIKTFVRRKLVGTEIVTDTSSQLVLQVLLSYPQLTVQSALRRMSIIAMSMHNDAILGLKTCDNSLTKEIILNDNEVDRFDLYVTRLLKMAIQNPRVAKEIGLLSGKDCLSYRVVTKSVERTADHAVNIGENSLLLKHGLSSQVLEMIEKMSSMSLKMFETSVESLFRNDYNLAENIIENISEISIIEKEIIACSEIDVENAANIRLIIESIRRTAEYSCDIAEVVLNLTVDSILV